jgi:hypothetical protein
MIPKSSRTTLVDRVWVTVQIDPAGQDMTTPNPCFSLCPCSFNLLHADGTTSKPKRAWHDSHECRYIPHSYLQRASFSLL